MSAGNVDRKVYVNAVFSSLPLGSEKTHTEKKTRKQHFHGIVPGFFWGILFMCFSPP